MGSWWLIVIAVATLVLAIRVSGHLTRQIAREGLRWCGVCGIEIAEGWVLYQVTPHSGHAEPTTRAPVYFCRRHRPADAGAKPWHV